MWLLFIILPTLVSYTFIGKLKLIKNRFLKLTLAWFLGQYLSLLIVFCLAVIFSLFSSSVLQKSAYLFIFILIIYVLKLYSGIIHEKILTRLKHSFKLVLSFKIFFLAVCFLFSVLLFKPHLIQTQGEIYTSPVYWDFNVHFPIIQNFVYGDNFPPENESFAGLPMTYHYYFDLLISIYSVFGLNLTGAINLVSVLMFVFMLVGIIGLCEELFGKSVIGYFAVVFAATSSSLHFINYIGARLYHHPLEILQQIITNSGHPYYSSFIFGNPFGYNGTMFNIFYFIAERQMIFGILYLIFSIAVIYYRKKIPKLLLFILGCLMGQFFEGHLFIVISVGSALGFLLLFDRERKQTLILLAGFSLVFLLHFIFLKFWMKPEFFYESVNRYPQFNLNFATMPYEYALSFSNALKYYLYAYGYKIFFVFAGFWILFKKNRRHLLLILSIIIPTFIFVNTLQLSPLSIYDNHKWLRPMNVVVDIIAAYGFYRILIYRRKLILKITAILIFPLLIFSGLIELMPFLNSKPTNFYTNYPTKMVIDIRNNTLPNEVFASLSSKEIHLAGRKLYVGILNDEPGAISFLDSGNFNKKRRFGIMRDIYTTTDPVYLCEITSKNDIDYVVLGKNDDFSIREITDNFPKFESVNEKDEEVIFLNIRDGCHGT